MQTLKMFLLIVMAVIAAPFAHAQQFNYKLDGPFKTSRTFMVQGTCEMCKHRIESSLSGIPGIWSSHWDGTSKTLKVTYDRSKLKSGTIGKLVSAQGHDIDSVTASTMVYNELPDCCQNLRKL